MQSVAQQDLTLAVMGFQKKMSHVTVLETCLRKMDLRLLSELVWLSTWRGPLNHCGLWPVGYSHLLPGSLVPNMIMTQTHNLIPFNHVIYWKKSKHFSKWVPNANINHAGYR